jgi:hypothetical protein
MEKTCRDIARRMWLQESQKQDGWDKTGRNMAGGGGSKNMTGGKPRGIWFKIVGGKERWNMVGGKGRTRSDEDG